MKGPEMHKPKGAWPDAAVALGTTLLLHGIAIVLLSLVISRTSLDAPQLTVTMAGESQPSPPAISLVTLPKSTPVKAQVYIPADSEIEMTLSDFAIATISMREYQTPVVPTNSKTVPTKSRPGLSGKSKEVSGWTGIRMDLDTHSGLPRIMEVIRGGPADIQKALRFRNEGDYIITVDGVSVANLPLEEVRDRITGPPGTEVCLGISSYPGAMVELVTIRRAEYRILSFRR